MTEWRRELNLQPADRRRRDQRSRPPGHPAPFVAGWLAGWLAAWLAGWLAAFPLSAHAVAPGDNCQLTWSPHVTISPAAHLSHLGEAGRGKAVCHVSGEPRQRDTRRSGPARREIFTKEGERTFDFGT